MTMTRTAWIATLLVAMVSVPAAEAQQRLPGEVLTKFVDAVRATQGFQVASQLRLAETTQAAEKWHKSLDVTARLTARSFIGDLIDQNIDLGGGSSAVLTWKAEKNQSVLAMIVAEGGNETVYRVEPTDLAEFRFQYVATITVVDPANMPRDTLSFQQANLSQVAETIALMGNIDLAIGLKSRDMPQLNLTLRHKSPAEALRFAAQAAGWSVEFAVDGQKSPKIPNQKLRSMDLQNQYEIDRLTGPVLGPDGEAVESLLDFAQIKFLEVARQMQRNRPVAVLQMPESDIPEVRLR
ncbi:MAG: hypothetical protein ACLFUJ_11755 [Phycisphaerae bacterium]